MSFRQPRLLPIIILAVMIALLVMIIPASASSITQAQASSQHNGFRTLNGEEARNYKVPDDVILTQQEELKKSLLRSGADDAQEAFKLLESASHLYSEQSPEEQARALKILVSNCTLKGENIDPDYKKPFDLVAEGVRTANWYAQEDSNSQQ